MNRPIRKIALYALFIALCYLGTMLHIPFYGAMIHFGNIFCLLGALFLGGVGGGVCGSVGMGAFDLLNGWVLYAPQTILLKFFIGFICGSANSRLPIKGTYLRGAFSAALAVFFNMIFSPLFTFFTSKYLLGNNEAASLSLATWVTLPVTINAVVAVVAVSVLYRALRGPLIKSGLVSAKEL